MTETRAEHVKALAKRISRVLDNENMSDCAFACAYCIAFALEHAKPENRLEMFDLIVDEIADMSGVSTLLEQEDDSTVHS